jgi:phosphoglycolate phosphatase
VVRNIIFDWSGTLVDDLPAVWQASNFVFRQAGVPELSLAQFREEFCLPFTKFYDRYTPHVPMRQLEEWFHGRFRELQDLVTEIPHAREFLRFCRQQGIRTLLLSSVHPDHFRSQARLTGFIDYLDHPYTGVWDKRAKIRELLTDHQLDPRQTLFIGDMQHDMETARYGGVYACAVLTGFTRSAELRACQPDLLVEHLGELQRSLEQHQMDLALDEPSSLPSATSDPPRTVDSEARPPERFPIATVGALIFNDARQVLMVRTKKWSDLWGIPGGKIKFGESSIAALIREIKEETNLDLSRIQFVLAQDCIHSTEFYRDEHFVLLNYTGCCVGNPAVQLNHEAQDYRWVSLDEARQLPLNQPTRILLEAVAAAKPA